MKFISHSYLLLLCCLLPGLVAAEPLPFPPLKPDPTPEFRYPAAGGALDETWLFVDTLFDASPTRPDLYNAVPVDLIFSHNRRGYLALLHTVYRSSDAGQSWVNMDNLPPPATNTLFLPLRLPYYIRDAGIRLTENPSVNSDTLFLAVVNGDTEASKLRMIRGISGTPQLWPFEFFSQDDLWLTQVATPTHETVVAFAGLDGEVFRYDSTDTIIVDSLVVDSVFEDTVFVDLDTLLFEFHTELILRWDTLEYNFPGSWVADLEVNGNRVIAAGSHFITSEDSGLNWEALPAPDSTGVRDLAFAPDGLHGLACGGSTLPPISWVRRTEDGGQTWSARTLVYARPIQAVHMVTDAIGFAVGGDMSVPVGFIFRTDDGGATWQQELTTDAELRVVNSSRQNGATVNVIVAGAFPDFSGGVWRSALQVAAASGAIITLTPDTLNFGDVAAGTTSELMLGFENTGDEAIFLTAMTSNLGLFTTDWGAAVELSPGATTAVSVFFSPVAVGEYEGSLYVQNSGGQDIRVPLYGTSGMMPVDDADVALPKAMALSVWPNPGNAEFRISYEIARAQNISLRVFDVTGRLTAELVSGAREPGKYVVSWDAAAHASGLYFVRLDSQDGARITKKLLLVK